jgi:hypothetical protein
MARQYGGTRWVIIYGMEFPTIAVSEGHQRQVGFYSDIAGRAENGFAREVKPIETGFSC